MLITYLLSWVATPLNKAVAIGAAFLALVILYNVWAFNLRSQGAAQEAGKEAIIAAQHAQDVINETNKVDLNVNNNPTPQTELQKKWEQQ